MKDFKYGLAVIAVNALMWAPVAFASGPGGVSSPVINKVAIDSGTQQVTLSGSQFGAVAPELWLGNHRLEVVESTQNQVVAKLPVKLVPATYKLSVRNPRSAHEAPSLFVQIP